MWEIHNPDQVNVNHFELRHWIDQQMGHSGAKVAVVPLGYVVNQRTVIPDGCTGVGSKLGWVVSSRTVMFRMNGTSRLSTWMCDAKRYDVARQFNEHANRAYKEPVLRV